MSKPRLNQIPNEPELKDVLDLHKKDILLSLNSHHIGTVQSFDASNQTASVTINYKKTFFHRNADTGLYDPVSLDYPILVDCPVICLGGGATALTFPISKGDECLVLFNDRDLDNWFQGAPAGSVATARLHSFSDGIILVGLRSLNNALSDYDTIRAVLQNDEAMVGVGPTLVKIANNATSLNTLLQDLVTNIQNLVTATAAITVICAAPASPSSIPVNAVAILAVSASLTSLATQIAGLLE